MPLQKDEKHLESPIAAVVKRCKNQTRTHVPTANARQGTKQHAGIGGKQRILPDGYCLLLVRNWFTTVFGADKEREPRNKKP